jgi:hypothetical protein
MMVNTVFTKPQFSESALVQTNVLLIEGVGKRYAVVVKQVSKKSTLVM